MMEQMGIEYFKKVLELRKQAWLVAKTLKHREKEATSKAKKLESEIRRLEIEAACLKK